MTRLKFGTLWGFGGLGWTFGVFSAAVVLYGLWPFVAFLALWSAILALFSVAIVRKRRKSTFDNNDGYSASFGFSTGFVVAFFALLVSFELFVLVSFAMAVAVSTYRLLSLSKTWSQVSLPMRKFLRISC